MRIITLFLCFGLTILGSTSAEARHHRAPHHHHHHHRAHHYNTQFVAPDMYSPTAPSTTWGIFQTSQQPTSPTKNSVVGGRPSGCPHAFCGCGASLYLFGKIVPSLNLAWNWATHFPHIAMSSAQNGDVAVRRHHVVVVLANKGNGVFMVHDSNSGHHLTRIHDRQLGGYIFVRPHA